MKKSHIILFQKIQNFFTKRFQYQTWETVGPDARIHPVSRHVAEILYGIRCVT